MVGSERGADTLDHAARRALSPCGERLSSSTLFFFKNAMRGLPHFMQMVRLT